MVAVVPIPGNAGPYSSCCLVVRAASVECTPACFTGPSTPPCAASRSIGFQHLPCNNNATGESSAVQLPLLPSMPRPPSHLNEAWASATNHQMTLRRCIICLSQLEFACESERHRGAVSPHALNGSSAAARLRSCVSPAAQAVHPLITSDHLVVAAIPRWPTVTLASTSTFSTIPHRSCAARKHEAAEIGTSLRSCTACMYVFHAWSPLSRRVLDLRAGRGVHRVEAL